MDMTQCSINIAHIISVSEKLWDDANTQNWGKVTPRHGTLCDDNIVLLMPS